MTRAKILGTGRGLPERVVTNDDLAEFLDTSDTWIRERTGICQRRIAAKETLLELCEEAARQAMDQSGVEAGYDYRSHTDGRSSAAESLKQPSAGSRSGQRRML